MDDDALIGITGRPATEREDPPGHTGTLQAKGPQPELAAALLFALRSFAPPSGLPAISPARGEISLVIDTA
jgi:hypothetical protein